MIRKAFFQLIIFFFISTYCFAQYNWTGFYIGPNIGAANNNFTFGDINTNSFGTTYPGAAFYQISNVQVPNRGIVVVPGTTRPVAMSSTKKTTFSGGVQLGYMKQYNQWTFGLEGDVNYSSAKASQNVDDTVPPTALSWISMYGFHHSATTNFTESLRAKFGYVKNNSLIYATIGAIFTNIKIKAADYYNTTTYWAVPWIDNATHPTPAQDNFVATQLNESASHFTVGLTLGVGYEWRLSDKVSAAIEYRYSTSSFTFTSDSSVIVAHQTDARPVYSGQLPPNFQKIKLITNQVTARLNIHFGEMLNNEAKAKKNK